MDLTKWKLWTPPANSVSKGLAAAEPFVIDMQDIDRGKRHWLSKEAASKPVPGPMDPDEKTTALAAALATVLASQKQH